ncbi:MAG: hypothetical protein ACFNYA_04910, partial [Capnocytophaga granulosa]
DRAYFLKLSPLDAKRLGTSHILLIPLFGDKITYKYDIPISFEKFVQRWNSDTGIPDKRKRKKFKSVVAHW